MRLPATIVTVAAAAVVRRFLASHGFYDPTARVFSLRYQQAF
jgi:hypothetical protein